MFSFKIWHPNPQFKIIKENSNKRYSYLNPNKKGSIKIIDDSVPNVKQIGYF